MRRLWILAMFCHSTVLLAQEETRNMHPRISMGIFGGLNIPQLRDRTNNAVRNGYTSRMGEAFGITFSLPVSSGLGSPSSIVTRLATLKTTTLHSQKQAEHLNTGLAIYLFDEAGWLF
jgi:hypothetical protein